MKNNLVIRVKKEFDVLKEQITLEPNHAKKLQEPIGEKPRTFRANGEGLSLAQIAFIINMVKRSEKTKKEQKAKTQENESFAKEEQRENPAYDSRKTYGNLPSSSYVDYAKIFSYLGRFKAGSSYKSSFSEQEGSSEQTSKGSLIDVEAMDKGARHVKYFFPKAADFHSMLTSLVPVAGLSSGEWEQFKLWVKLDPVMYLLKTTIN